MTQQQFKDEAESRPPARTRGLKRDENLQTTQWMRRVLPRGRVD